MHDLEKFTNLYGKSDLIRTMEIKAPSTEIIFIRRLYEELNAIIINIEGGRKERCKDEEDRLSIEIVNCLKTAGYFAEKDPTQGGHVDFLVAPERNRNMKWYGEAKIWHGVAYLQKGINQLLSRYASGREKSLGLLIYFRDPGIVNKMSEWLSHINCQPDVDAAKSFPISEFSFCSTHHHSSGTNLEVQHFSVNVHWNPI